MREPKTPNVELLSVAILAPPRGVGAPGTARVRFRLNGVRKTRTIPVYVDGTEAEQMARKLKNKAWFYTVHDQQNANGKTILLSPSLHFADSKGLAFDTPYKWELPLER